MHAFALIERSGKNRTGVLYHMLLPVRFQIVSAELFSSKRPALFRRRSRRFASNAAVT